CAPATKPACPEPTAARGGSTTWAKPCGGATTAEHGVQAGTGGAFDGSMTALVAGGVLIAGACGAAAHRLRLRLRGEDGGR
ncbi:secreted protein, partial [Streptomyces coelicoflavus ZG0656]